MTLQQILFGEFKAPPITNTRHIRISGWERCARYKALPAKPNLKAETTEKMFTLIKERPGITCQEVAKELGRNIAYIYEIRAILLDTNRIEAVRQKRASGGGLSFSALYVKERDHGC